MGMYHCTDEVEAKARTAKGFASLTDEEKIELIMESIDGGRLETQGGYPSQYVIENGKVYVATVDHDDGPELIALPIARFIAEYDWVFENYIEGH